MAKFELYHGDCLEILPRLAGAFAIVSDVPYGIDYKSGKIANNSISSTKKRFSERIEGDNKPFDPAPFLSYSNIAFTGAQHFYDKLPAGGSLHCWDKRGEYKPLDQADADFVWISRNIKSRTLHLVWRGICRHTENKSPYLHPTQKPIALMTWIIVDLLQLDKSITIVDPYMGSGTTGISALQNGYQFIGIEKVKKYFDIAKSRIEEAARQPSLLEVGGITTACKGRATHGAEQPELFNFGDVQSE